MKKYLLIILLIFQLQITFSNSDSNKTVKQTISKDTSGFNETKAYKMLYDNQVKSNDAILKTIFYALGGLGIAVLLVFASNWWFNDKKVKDVLKEIDSKINEIKKDTLAELTNKINLYITEKTTKINETQAKIQKIVTSTLTDITAKTNDFTEKIRAEIKEDNRVLTNNYQELIKTYNENLTQQISSIKESYEEKLKHLSNKIEENENKFKEQLLDESKSLKREILSHDAEIAFLKGNYNIALKAYLNYAIFNFEIHYEWSFKYDSKAIIKCLENVTYIWDDEFEALNTLINLSKEKFPEESDTLRTLCKDKPIQKLPEKKT